MENINIYLDLDGTVADFEKAADEVLMKAFGYRFKEATNMVMKWVKLTKLSPSLYRNLELLPDAKVLIDELRYLDTEVKVLTAIPSQAIFPDVTTHKREWVKEKLNPLFNYDVEVLFGPYSKDKAFHCKGKNDILIDDNILCIKQWTNAGGIGILHTSAANTVKKLNDAMSTISMGSKDHNFGLYFSY